MGVRYKRQLARAVQARSAQAAAPERESAGGPLVLGGLPLGLQLAAPPPGTAVQLSGVGRAFWPQRCGMDYSQVIFSLLLVLCPGAQHAGAELSAAVPEARPSSAPWPLRRSKRCSCSSLMDKECVYFCHLDIIWINTPERTVSYGLGGPSRPRRSLEDTAPGKQPESAKRCQCANQKDKKCLNFCQTGQELWAQSTMEKGWDHLNKGNSCTGFRLKCVYRQLLNNRKMRRHEATANSIKASFSVAKLKAARHEVKRLKDNKTHKRQRIWESLKTTS
ncbi:endothelin-1 [Carettochelys insculpta]|uniref:endothelin-1 n=1 Tax=Carettochelys insculpta TaxID=44489 RepID=UPI003EB802D2